MAKIKYNVEGADSGRTPPKPGTYPAKVHSIKDRRDEDGKNDLEVVLEITDGKFKGARVWTYLNFGEASAWKFAEFVKAIGKPTKGAIDDERDVGKKLGIVIAGDEWKGEYRARVSKFLTADSLDDDEEEGEDLDDEEADEDEDADEDESDGEDDEDDEDEEEEEPPPPPKSKSKAKSKKAPEPEPEDDEDEEAEEESEEPEDYEKWSEDELREELESRGMSVRGSKKALISRITKDDASTKPF